MALILLKWKKYLKITAIIFFLLLISLLILESLNNKNKLKNYAKNFKEDHLTKIKKLENRSRLLLSKKKENLTSKLLPYESIIFNTINFEDNYIGEIYFENSDIKELIKRQKGLVKLGSKIFFFNTNRKKYLFIGLVTDKDEFDHNLYRVNYKVISKKNKNIEFNKNQNFLLSLDVGQSTLQILLTHNNNLIFSVNKIVILSLILFLIITYTLNTIRDKDNIIKRIFILFLLINLFLISILLKKFQFIFNFFYLQNLYHFNNIALISIYLLIFLTPLIILKKISKHKLSLIEKLFILISITIFYFYVPFYIFIIYLIIFIIKIYTSSYKNQYIYDYILILLISSAIAFSSTNYQKKIIEDYIENSLSKIFSNQSNYSKLIVMEIIKTINKSYTSLEEIIDNKKISLEHIWNQSYASKENVASGIYIFDKDKVLIDSFSYKLPYFKYQKDNFLPFWNVENTDINQFGVTVPVSSASIAVTHKGEIKGYIVIFVANSPQLLLNEEKKINIFTINKSISSELINYVKFDSNYNIVENPAIVNIDNIKIKKFNLNTWYKFYDNNNTFNGYLFNIGKYKILIYYSQKKILEIFSLSIKIFLFFFFILMLITFLIKRKEIFKYLKTFSFKISLILITIIVVASLFYSLNFYNFLNNNVKRENLIEKYRTGELAIKYIDNLISVKDQFTSYDLFFLSTIIKGDITVYLNKYLIDTTNYKFISEHKIPKLINSKIIPLIDKDGKKIIIKENIVYIESAGYLFRLDLWNKSTLKNNNFFNDFILILSFLLISVGMIISLYLKKKLMFPISKLRENMLKVENNQLLSLLNKPKEDEFISLYNSFNSMIIAIKEQKKSISEVSEMKTLIKMGRRVAHEVKNPLMPIRLSAEQIVQSIKDKKNNYEKIIKDSAGYIIEETEHLKKVSLGFLDLTRLEKINYKKFNIRELINNEIYAFSQLFPKIDFVFNFNKEKFLINGDELKIKQLIKNIIVNAIEAKRKKKTKIIINLLENNKNIELIIADNGKGFDEKIENDFFKENFTTKKNGSGLGLYICYKIVKMHRGNIGIKYNKQSAMTEVKVEIPINKDNV